jgi:DNA-binding response OmpR family regulator
MHILVVEDEKRLAYLLRRVLLEERHTIDLAHEGHTGLNLALMDSRSAGRCELTASCRLC